MRILFWQESFGNHVGGIRVVAESLLPALRNRGHQVVLVTAQNSPRQPHHDEWKGFPLRRFPFWQVLDRKEPRTVLAIQREIERLVHDFAPDVIHVSGFGPTALFARYAQRSRMIRLVVSLHSSNTVTCKPASLFAYTLERADWISTCSGSLLAAARESVPAIVHRSSVVYNGVAIPAVTPRPLPYAPPRLLCLGYLDHHKGYDLVLSATPALLTRFPTLRVMVAGEGPVRAALEQQARLARIADAVEFRDAVPHAAVAELINSATLVVVPSRRESFGLVAAEAAMLQRPVVATRVGGLPEIVVDNETGLLVPPDDSAALAAAIGRLLADRQLAEHLGRTAADRARCLFALPAQCDAFESIYARACGPDSLASALAQAHGVGRI